MIWSSGAHFLGKWRQGKMHGEGFIKESAKSIKRKGFWIDGKRRRWLS